MSKYIYDDYDDMIIPYKAKKQKKKTKKSNHKHNYEKIICKYFVNSREHYCLAEECVVCGKINNYKFSIDMMIESKGCRKMFPTLDEILEVYLDLKIVDIEKLW